MTTIKLSQSNNNIIYFLIHLCNTVLGKTYFITKKMCIVYSLLLIKYNTANNKVLFGPKLSK